MSSAVRHSRLVLVGRCLPDDARRHEQGGKVMLSQAGEEPVMLPQRIVDRKFRRSDSPNLDRLGTLPLPVPLRTAHLGEASRHRFWSDQIDFDSKR